MTVKLDAFDKSLDLASTHERWVKPALGRIHHFPDLVGIFVCLADMAMRRAMVAEAKLAADGMPGKPSAAASCYANGHVEPTGYPVGSAKAQGMPAPCVQKHAGHAGYLALLKEMKALHIRKANDYGSNVDPLANIRASSEIGVEPWRAAWLRAKDKVTRIDQFASRGSLSNESVEDSLMDLAAYALICLALRREDQQPKEKVA